MSKSASRLMLRCDPICRKNGTAWELIFGQLSALSVAQRRSLLQALLAAQPSPETGDILASSLGSLDVDVVGFSLFWPGITRIPEIMAAGLTLALQRASANNVPIATVWKSDGEDDAFLVQVVELQGCVLMELITPPAPRPVPGEILSTFNNAWIVGDSGQIGLIHDAILSEFGFDDPVTPTGVTAVSSIQQHAIRIANFAASTRTAGRQAAPLKPKARAGKAKRKPHPKVKKTATKTKS